MGCASSKDMFATMRKPEDEDASLKVPKQVPPSDHSAYAKALADGWKVFPGKYLGGYSSLGPTGLTMQEAMDKCLSTPDAQGINLQFDEHGGTLWTLRSGKDPLVPGAPWNEDNLVCLRKP